MAIAGRPGREAVGRAVRASPVAMTTRVVAVSMARIPGRRPSCVEGVASGRRSCDRLEVALVARRTGHERDLRAARRRSPRCGRPGEPAGSASPSRSGHSTSVTPLDLAVVERPAGQRVGRVGEPIQVEVEERQAARVLGHEDEARRGDRLGRRRARPRSPWPAGSCPPRARPTGRPGRPARATRASARPERGRRLGIGAADGVGSRVGRVASTVEGTGPSVRPPSGRRSRPAGSDEPLEVADRARPRPCRPASRTAPASRWTPPANRRGPEQPGPRSPRVPARSPPRMRTRSGGGVGRATSGASNRSAGGSLEIATSRPASARRTASDRARHRSPERRRRARGPRTAGSRWRAARWRVSEARKSRRSLLARPATTMPRMPIARARVSVSASIREPTTRIVPASPTSRPPARSSPSARPRRGAGRGSDRRGPRCPAWTGRWPG